MSLSVGLSMSLSVGLSMSLSVSLSVSLNEDASICIVALMCADHYFFTLDICLLYMYAPHT